jgi:hypothetical protein
LKRFVRAMPAGRSEGGGGEDVSGGGARQIGFADVVVFHELEMGISVQFGGAEFPSGPGTWPEVMTASR